MRDKWQDKKAKALAQGENEQPLINYADFMRITRIFYWAKLIGGIALREYSSVRRPSGKDLIACVLFG